MSRRGAAAAPGLGPSHGWPGAGEQLGDVLRSTWSTHRRPVLSFARRWLSVATFVGSMIVVGAWAWRPVFWVDEYLTQRAVARSWPDLFVWVRTTDPGPAPYYVLIKLWSYASIDPFWLRLPSILAMAGALAVLVTLVQRLAGIVIAVLTIAVLLALPIVSRFGQENRPYAFALLGAVAAVSCWSSAMERPGRRRSLVWFGLAVAGAGLAHLYTLALLPALGLAAALRPPGERGRAIRRTVGPALVAVVVISPHILANLATPTGSPTDGPLSWRSLLGLQDRLMPDQVAVGLVVLAGLGIAYAVRRPRLRPAVVIALCWAVVPVVLLLSAKAFLDLPVTKARYLLFVIPSIALLAALGLRRLAAWWRPLAVLVLVLLVAAGAPRQVEIRDLGGHNRDWPLGPILSVAAARHIPTVAANHQAIRLVDAATYPRQHLSLTADPRRDRLALVVERVRYAEAVPEDFSFYRPTGPWRPVLDCPVAQSTVRVFASRLIRPEARDQEVDRLAAQLNKATGGTVVCHAVDGLAR